MERLGGKPNVVGLGLADVRHPHSFFSVASFPFPLPSLRYIERFPLYFFFLPASVLSIVLSTLPSVLQLFGGALVWSVSGGRLIRGEVVQ